MKKPLVCLFLRCAIMKHGWKPQHHNPASALRGNLHLKLPPRGKKTLLFLCSLKLRSTLICNWFSSNYLNLCFTTSSYDLICFLCVCESLCVCLSHFPEKKIFTTFLHVFFLFWFCLKLHRYVFISFCSLDFLNHKSLFFIIIIIF